jgi:iron(III) transport system permease protein
MSFEIGLLGISPRHLYPLVAPIVQALALIYLFGRNGLITSHFFNTDWNIYGAIGIIVSEVLYCLPHAFVILFTTLSAVDIRLDEAAESLGASPFKVFTRITLPSAKYGIISAAALTFNLTITDFGNPVVIGGNYSVLATEIYAQVANLYRFDLGLPSVLFCWCRPWGHLCSTTISHAKVFP